MEAINEELNSMTNLKVYEIIKNIPENISFITTHWIFKYKIPMVK